MSVDEDPLALLPELILLVAAVAILLIGAFLPRPRQWIGRLIALAALIATIVAAAVTAGEQRTVYEHSYAIDVATTTARLIIAGAALLVITLSADRVAGSRRESEFYVLVLLASLGATVLAGTSDLLLLAVGYLLASIPLYALAGWDRRPRAEAALKIYLLGALFGILMLLGITLLVGVSGGRTTYEQVYAGLLGAPNAAVALGIVAVFAGLLFKIGAVPAHFWIPDVAAGATTPAAAFVTTVPKIGALIALYRLAAILPDGRVDWRLLLAIIAAVSMTLGNLAAFRQSDPKRLLGYSTISQVGYLLMAVVVVDRTPHALAALLTYLAAYAVTNVGAFAVVAALPQRRTLADYAGAARQHPALIASLVVCLLGLVGTPPTAVFVGKLSVFTATWDGGLAWLVVIAAVNTVASLYYYLRWLAPAVLRPSDAAAEYPRERSCRWAAITAILAGVAALATGVVAIPLFDIANPVLTR